MFISRHRPSFLLGRHLEVELPVHTVSVVFSLLSRVRVMTSRSQLPKHPTLCQAIQTLQLLVCQISAPLFGSLNLHKVYSGARSPPNPWSKASNLSTSKALLVLYGLLFGLGWSGNRWRIRGPWAVRVMEGRVLPWCTH